MTAPTKEQQGSRERPILFRGPMVRAILEGRKTQTRRVMKDQPPDDGRPVVVWVPGSLARSGALVHNVTCPYGKRGDRLWVRETWFANGSDSEVPIYRADRSDGEFRINGRSAWRSGIIMPRKLSRLTLTITDVRVQRLNEISQEDAIAEGCAGHPVDGHADYPDCHWPADEFRDLWSSINGKRHPWDSNPFVWAISFTPTGTPAHD